MKQSPTVHPPASECAIEGPIVVLGRQNDYFFVSSKVEDFFAEVALYRAQDPTSPGLRFAELDFFDGAGRPLEPVLSAEGELTGLVLKDVHREIAERIAQVFELMAPKLQEEGIDLEQVPVAVLLSQKLPPEQLIQRLAEQTRAFIESNFVEIGQFTAGQCSAWEFMWGHCR